MAALFNLLYQGIPRWHQKEFPHRLNMKFSQAGKRIVIHLVGGLPPKMSRNKKTITITFPEQKTIRSRFPEATVNR